MSSANLDIAVRVLNVKRSSLRTLRLSGRIPGVIYGGILQPVLCVSICSKNLLLAFERHRDDLIRGVFSYEGENIRVQEFQYDAFGKVVHVDFTRV